MYFMVRIENVHWHHYSRGYLSRELRGFLHILRSYVINNNNSKNKPFYCSKFDCGGSFNWRLSWSLNCQQFFTCSRDMIDRSVLFHSWNQEQKRAEKPCFLINFNHDKYMYILYIYIYIYIYILKKIHPSFSKPLRSILIKFIILNYLE